jgi:hypothetical protein
MPSTLATCCTPGGGGAGWAYATRDTRGSSTAASREGTRIGEADGTVRGVYERSASTRAIVESAAGRAIV